MRLPPLNEDLQSQLDEFDIWITPSLGEIVDTRRFKDELRLVSSTFEAMGRATSDFADTESCTPDRLTDIFIDALRDREPAERQAVLDALASTLFAVTGKSDNNFKCQFPIYLRDEAGWAGIPAYKRRRRTARVSSAPIPRTLSSRRLMSIVANMNDASNETRLLKQFLSFVLRDQSAVNQLWALGSSYFAMKRFGRESDLLSPIVAFKVRGSVMASSGHEPEHILRELLTTWGLRADVDFNTTDVVVANIEDDVEAKTRAYDFVLPYKTPGWQEDWNNRLFVQCQFYAGDSGSVSHKNVDQTRSSRESVGRLVQGARFIEYVDGAGYFSSLNGDLRRLLAYEDTQGLFQIRTAPVRLRAYLEQIGFLTPLKVEQAAALAARSSRTQIKQRLIADGFPSHEVERAINDCLDRSLLVESGRRIVISEERHTMVRRYLLLDHAVQLSKPLDRAQLAGKVLVPGYGPFHGVDLAELADTLTRSGSLFSAEYANSTTLLSDITYLAKNGYVLSR